MNRDPLGISGTLIADKYRVDRAIGEGGFSVVYLAEHTIWQQPVAIKCFKILANAPEDQREKLLNGFIQEGKLMAQLSSRSAAIVQARDVGTFTTPSGQWIPYMVLEWLDGKPLDHVLWHEKQAAAPPRTVMEAMTLLEPAAVALELVHSRGIAHRDIKPANFFVIGDARSPGALVKVLDFGIAKVMAEHAEAKAALAQTGTELTAFTPNYGAPEQFSRTYGATGPWTDVFAMALILVEVMRSGEPALDGGDFLQLAVASRDPLQRPSPRRYGLPVSDAVEQVFLKALAIAPADRYASMGEFWAALMHALFPEAPTWNIASAAGGVGGPTMSQRFQNLPPLSSISTTAPRPATGQGPYPTLQPVGSAVPPPAPTPPGYRTGAGPSAPPGPGSAPPYTMSSQQPVSASPLSPALLYNAPVPVPAGQAKKSGLPLALVGVLAVAALGGGAFFGLRAMNKGPGPAAAGTASAEAPVKGSATVAAPPASASAAVAARRTTCPDGMVLVPGGKFFMGSDDAAFKLWQPAHKVTVDTFCIDLNEVTASQYKACSDVGECKRPDPVPSYPKADSVSEEQHTKNQNAYAELCNFGKPDRNDHPINCVSWQLADSYCKFKKGRLPTEAEWEYAARGSDGRKFPWGDEAGSDSSHMNACGTECNKWEVAHGLKPSARMYEADDGYPGTAPVGSFPKGKTKFGANDFVGNVWEWTSDWFETYKPDEAINPTGAPAGEKKAIRGGGFNGGVLLWLNPAFRYFQVATASAPAIGFRCAATL